MLRFSKQSVPKGLNAQAGGEPGQTSAIADLRARPDARAAGIRDMTVGLIGPDEPRRMAVFQALGKLHVGVVKEYSEYPKLEDVARIAEHGFGTVIIDLDVDHDHALKLVEEIWRQASTTVMVYSARADEYLMIQSLRAGAREYLAEPIANGELAEALERASARRLAASPTQVPPGKLFVFLGTKGGSGVTTMAANFAVHLARESNKRTLLVDLDLPFGDAAAALGVKSEYSILDALLTVNRLDARFLTRIAGEFSPTLSVLGAPDQSKKMEVVPDAVYRVIALARKVYDYVVVDAGSNLNITNTKMFEESTVLYLVTHVSLPGLRNANRLMLELLANQGIRIEVILNRYKHTFFGIGEREISKALTRPARWKIPPDAATAERTRDTCSLLAPEDSAISRVTSEIARTVCAVAEARKER